MLLIDLYFRGTPYDFSYVVSDFITDYPDWKGCITPQQKGVNETMPNFSVEFQCPDKNSELPAFAWLIARRHPDGGSSLRIESDDLDYPDTDSPQLETLLNDLMDFMKRQMVLIPRPELQDWCKDNAPEESSSELGIELTPHEAGDPSRRRAEIDRKRGINSTP